MHKHRRRPMASLFSFLLYVSSLSPLSSPFAISVSPSLSFSLFLPIHHLLISSSLSFRPRALPSVQSDSGGGDLFYLTPTIFSLKVPHLRAASGNAVHYIPGVLSCLPVLFAFVAVARCSALLRTFEKTSLPRLFILNRAGSAVPRRRARRRDRLYF